MSQKLSVSQVNIRSRFSANISFAMPAVFRKKEYCHFGRRHSISCATNSCFYNNVWLPGISGSKISRRGMLDLITSATSFKVLSVISLNATGYNFLFISVSLGVLGMTPEPYTH